MEPIASFGEWVRARRTNLHLTQGELASQVHCSSIMIRKIEADERRPSSEITRHLAVALRIPADLGQRFLRVARGELSPDHLPLLEPERRQPGRWLPVLSRADLAIPTTSFLGRIHEIAQVCDLIQQPNVRLLTLVGAPGIGKSRLSLHAAAELGDAFLDGVHFVPLAPLRDPTLVPDAVAQIFGFAESSFPTPLDYLKVELRHRHLLIVLDNFEQVLPAGSFLQELMQVAPYIKLLVTSRTILSLPEEHLITVPALEVSETDSSISAQAAIRFPAVQLLVARARATDPAFTLTAQNAGTAVSLCARLDGLPLAIELAAARLPSLSPAEMVESLMDRMVLTADERERRPERHYTLRSAIAWSIDLLPRETQIIYARLGVFVHGATHEAAEVVCRYVGDIAGDFHSQLMLLVTHNLVRTEASIEETRFTMLETILEYARELLATRQELTAARRAHSTYFCEWIEVVAPKILGLERQVWLKRVEQDNDNLRAALQWAKEIGDTDILTRLVAALGWFWELQGRRLEARLWINHALSTPVDEQPVAARAKVLQMVGTIADEEGDLDRSRLFAEQSMALTNQIGDIWTAALAQRDLAFVYFAADNDAEKARVELGQCISTLKMVGDLRNHPLTLLDMAIMDLYLGDARHGMPYAQEALRLAEERDDLPTATEAKGTLGMLAHALGDHETSIRLLEEGLATARQLPNGKQAAWKHYHLAAVLLECGHLARAYEHFTESARLWKERLEPLAVAFCESGRANALFRQGQISAAAELHKSVLAIYLQFDNWRGIAWTYWNLANVAASEGDYTEVGPLLMRSLEIFRERDDAQGIRCCEDALHGIWALATQPRRR